MVLTTKLSIPDLKVESLTTQRHRHEVAQLAGSLVVVSLILLIACDLMARACLHFNRYTSINRSWIWWAVKDLNQTHTPPDIVIFGSSLMLAALNKSDATYTNVKFDATTHHQAQYLNHLLSKGLHMPVSSFSFAIGGQMASDVYAIASSLLTKEHTPSVILWGIAPRDFLDATFDSPGTTETVRYMNKINQTHLTGERQPFWESLEEHIGQLIFSYGKREYIAHIMLTLIQTVLSKIGILSDSVYIHTPDPLLHIVKTALPEDVAPNQYMVSPDNKHKTYNDNSEEYKHRYNPFKRKTLSQQLSYLEKFLCFTQSHNIRVCLLNMPLTRDNMNLLPPDSYEQYLNNVEQLAAKYKASMWDLNQPGIFEKNEFSDPIHLTGFGGIKLCNIVANKLERELLTCKQNPH